MFKCSKYFLLSLKSLSNNLSCSALKTNSAYCQKNLHVIQIFRVKGLNLVIIYGCLYATFLQDSEMVWCCCQWWQLSPHILTRRKLYHWGWQHLDQEWDFCWFQFSWGSCLIITHFLVLYFYMVSNRCICRTEDFSKAYNRCLKCLNPIVEHSSTCQTLAPAPKHILKISAFLKCPFLHLNEDAWY